MTRDQPLHVVLDRLAELNTGQPNALGAHADRRAPSPHKGPTDSEPQQTGPRHGGGEAERNNASGGRNEIAGTAITHEAKQDQAERDRTGDCRRRGQKPILRRDAQRKAAGAVRQREAEPNNPHRYQRDGRATGQRRAAGPGSRRRGRDRRSGAGAALRRRPARPGERRDRHELRLARVHRLRDRVTPAPRRRRTRVAAAAEPGALGRNQRSAGRRSETGRGTVPNGTTVVFPTQAMTRRNWLQVIGMTARHLPVPVYVDGTRIDQKGFLNGCIHVERCAGGRTGIRKGRFAGEQPRLSFLGLQAMLRGMPSLTVPDARHGLLDRPSRSARVRRRDDDRRLAV